MARKKKSFINKKEARHFHLVHKSQFEFLNEGSKHESDDGPVFEEYIHPSARKHQMKKCANDDMSDEEDIMRENTKIHDDNSENDPEDFESEDITEQFGAAAQYGIFFEDQNEYNYLQHLKEVGRSPNAVWIEAPKKEKKQPVKKEIVFKGEAKEDPAKEIEESAEGNILVDEKLDFSNMTLDPEVIEALEALEDDTYVNEFNQDFIREIAAEDDLTDN